MVSTFKSSIWVAIVLCVVGIHATSLRSYCSASSNAIDSARNELVLKDSSIKSLQNQVDLLQARIKARQAGQTLPTSLTNALPASADPLPDISKLDKPAIHQLFLDKDRQIAHLRSQLSDLQRQFDALANASTDTPAAANVAPPPTSVPNYHYVKTLEMKLEPSISFSPQAIAVDNNGNLYVSANKLGIRVYKDGDYQYSIGYPDMADANRGVEANGVPLEGDSGSDFPRADPIFRAHDPSGDPDFVLIDDRYTMPVRGHIWQGDALYVDGSAVFVIDNFTERLQVFVDGECKRCIDPGIPPGGRDSTGRFTGVASIDNHTIFFLDAANNCLTRTTVHGGDVKATTFGFMGTGDAELNGPVSMAYDRDKQEMYICDALHYRVAVFDTEGKFIRSFGAKGTGDGQFTQIYGIAADKDGRIYVGDKTRIEVFSNDGTYLTQFGTVPENIADKSAFEKLINVYAIAVDSSGNVYASDPSGYNVKVYAKDAPAGTTSE